MKIFRNHKIVEETKRGNIYNARTFYLCHKVKRLTKCIICKPHLQCEKWKLLTIQSLTAWNNVFTRKCFIYSKRIVKTKKINAPPWSYRGFCEKQNWCVLFGMMLEVWQLIRFFKFSYLNIFWEGERFSHLSINLSFSHYIIHDNFCQ